MWRQLYDAIDAFFGALLNALDLEELDVGVVPDWGVSVPQVDDAPHVGPEPHGCSRIGLVLPDKDRMGHRKKAYEGSVL